MLSTTKYYETDNNDKLLNTQINKPSLSSIRISIGGPTSRFLAAGGRSRERVKCSMKGSISESSTIATDTKASVSVAVKLTVAKSSGMKSSNAMGIWKQADFKDRVTMNDYCCFYEFCCFYEEVCVCARVRVCVCMWKVNAHLCANSHVHNTCPPTYSV